MWSASLTRPVGVLITLMEPATPQVNAPALEDHPRAPVPRASEFAACSLSPAAQGLTPTLPTPSSTPSTPQPTGTPAPTPTAGVVRTSVSSGNAVTVYGWPLSTETI